MQAQNAKLKYNRTAFLLEYAGGNMVYGGKKEEYEGKVVGIVYLLQNAIHPQSRL